MTHDELLAKLADIHNKYSDAGAEANKQYKGMVMFYFVLRAVVELHKPTKAIKGADEYDACKHCYPTVYPCPTIQAIEKELN
jgi:hypothetical protein